MTPPEANEILDLSCAYAGRKAANFIGENGVSVFSDLTSLLHYEGLYKVFAFLESKAKKETGTTRYLDIGNLFFSVLKEHLPGVALNPGPNNALELCGAFQGRLEDLIQAKTLLQRCLDYASAYAKCH
jgi:CRISPR/Cas system CMR-associated protein Cmr5 small subunit